MNKEISNPVHSILFFALLCVMITSCGQKDKSLNNIDNVEAAHIPLTERKLSVTPPPSPRLESVEVDDTDVNAYQHPGKSSDSVEKKIIRDGRIGVEVEDLEAAKISLDQLVESKGAYYSMDRFDDLKNESSYFLKIRIPSKEFESFISEVSAEQWKVNYKEIKSRDVTAEFIDLETRLANKRKYLEKYRDLLKTAGRVKDILEIEKEIRTLEEEIESTTGRLNYLKDLVGYSTLDLVLKQKKEFKFDPEAQDSFLERLKYSLSRGWKNAVSFLLFLFRFWPFWIISLLLVFGIGKYRKFHRSKK